MKKKQSTSKNGFTLLEILVSVGALAIMGVLLTQVFVTTTRTNIKNEITKDVKQNGDLAMEVMTRMIQNATDVTSSCQDIGSSGPSLTIINLDSGSTTFECRSDSGLLRIASTSASTAYLTSPSVKLTGADCPAAFTVTCTLLPSGQKSVNISFSLSQGGTSPVKIDQANQKFETTVTLRNQ